MAKVTTNTVFEKQGLVVSNQTILLGESEYQLQEEAQVYLDSIQTLSARTKLTHHFTGFYLKAGEEGSWVKSDWKPVWKP